MKYLKNAKKHIALNFLLLSCAMLLLAVYASKILAGDTTATSINTETAIGTQNMSQKPTTTETASAASTEEKIVESTAKATSVQTIESTAKSVTTNATTIKKTESATTPTNVTPNFVFTSPSNGKTIQTNADISGTVSDAKNVEFYLIAENSNTKKYIGTARKNAGNNWSLSLDLKNIPNGTFQLIAKIENAYGTYESGKIKITIAFNQSVENNTSAKISTTATTTASKSNSNATTTTPASATATSNTTTSNTTTATGGTAINKNTSSGEAQTQPTAKENTYQAPEIATQVTNYNGETSPEWQKKYFGNENCQRADYCGGTADPDNDGLNNNDEYRYKTDPLNPDTDGDSYLDGTEIKNGFNPLKPSDNNKADKIIFENPKEKGEIKKNIYAVTNVELIKVADEKKLKLTGKGLPDSFVTVYIYSSLPIILTVKTDANGDWSYTMDKQLDNGEHEVYVAVTDNTGKITAKSEPLPFIKTAEAATVTGADMTARAKTVLAPTEARTGSDLLLIFAIILLALGLVFSIISLTAVYRAQKEKI